MSNAIRIISSKNNVETVQVYNHEVLVRRVGNVFECECRRVTVCGYVQCELAGDTCWHVPNAVKHVLEHEGHTVEWSNEYEEMHFEWGTQLDSDLYTVQRKGALPCYVVAREKQGVPHG